MPDLLTNLEGYWKLDSNANDSSVNVRDGAATGITWVAGKLNNCAQYTALGDQIVITGYKGVLAAAARSTSFWVKKSAAPTTTSRGCVYWGHATSGYWLAQLRHGGLAQPGAIEIRTSSTTAKWGSTNVCDGSWHHVVITHDGSADMSGTKIYIDGVEETTYYTAGSQTVSTTSQSDVYVGREPTFNSIFTGELDEVGIWSRELPQADIDILYNDGNVGPFDNWPQIFPGVLLDTPWDDPVPWADLEEVTETFDASTPIEADLITSETCDVFSSVTVTVLGPTSIRVNFPTPAKNNSALVQAGNYVITPSRNVYSVTPEAVAEPNYVDLEIDEQQTGVSYEVEVQGVEKA